MVELNETVLDDEIERIRHEISYRGKQCSYDTDDDNAKLEYHYCL